MKPARSIHPDLHHLPQLQPPEALQARIHTSYRRRPLRIGAAVLALLLPLILLGVILRPQQPSPVDWQTRSQLLEQQLDRHGSLPANVAAARDALSRIDHQLATAYAGNTPQSRRTHLWRTRSELLEALIAAQRQHLRVSAI